MSDRKEQFLLFRIRAFHDTDAFDALYFKYRPSVQRFLRQKLPGLEEADDALSQTFERVWNYLRSAEVEHASGLIFTIARGVVAEYYRSRKQEVSYDADPAFHGSVGDGGQGAGALTAEAETSLIRRKMESLSERDRELITLRHLEGLPPREIARRLDMKEASVRMALHRAMKRLREQYEHDGKGTDPASSQA